MKPASRHYAQAHVTDLYGKDIVDSETTLRPKLLSGIEVEIYGDLYGCYYGGEVYDRANLIEAIVKSQDESAFLDMLRHSVGNFFVVRRFTERGYTEVYTSPGGHGVFYCRTDDAILVSNLDLPLLQYCRSHRVDQMELLHLIVSGRLPSPFKTLLCDLERMIGGCRLRVTSDLHASVYFYSGANSLHDNQVPRSYHHFVNVLEGQSEVIVRECRRRGQQIFPMLSGGIDSTVLALALRNVGGDFVPVIGMPSNYRDAIAYEYSWGNANKITRFLEWPLRILNFDETDPRLFDQFALFQRFLARNPDLQNLSCVGTGYNSENRRDLVISGNCLDSVYAVKFSKGRPWVPKSKSGLNKFLKESCFTQEYLSIMLRSNILTSALGAIASNSRLRRATLMPTNALHYMLEMIICIVRWFPHGMVQSLPIHSLFSDFVEYKRQTVLEPLLLNSTCGELAANQISASELSHLVRRVAYAVYISNRQLTFHTVQEATQQNYFLTPATQGPIFEYFLWFPLYAPDVLRRKNFLYRYFAERTGSEYWEIIDSAWDNEFAKDRNSIPQASFFEYNLTRDTCIHDMFLQLNLQDSVLLDTAESPELRDYLYSWYQELASGELCPSHLSYWENVHRYNTVLRLCEIENYLKGII